MRTELSLVILKSLCTQRLPTLNVLVIDLQEGMSSAEGRFRANPFMCIQIYLGKVDYQNAKEGDFSGAQI